MRTTLVGTTVLACLLAALTLGCASYPVSKEYRRRAIDVEFSKVRANPSVYIGETVIWGGMILETARDSNVTVLEILQVPLDRSLEPTDVRLSRGRFLATTARFLDPEVFEQELMVTVAGVVIGADTLPLDGGTYVYPVIDIREINLLETSWYRYDYPPGYYYDYWYPGYRYYYYPHRRRYRYYYPRHFRRYDYEDYGRRFEPPRERRRYGPNDL
ncbi:MAG: hypothetical protein GF331_00380 [Chitinivibrionales bacterium]|nr:hypothetical protein [Chitinivibrionales bacterium]